MAHPMKGKADSSKSAKRSSIGVTTSQGDHYKGAGQRTLAAPDKASGKPAGGFKAGEGASVKGEKTKARLDRPKRALGGGVHSGAGFNGSADKGSNFNSGEADDPRKPPAKANGPVTGSAATDDDATGPAVVPGGGSAGNFANGGNVGKRKSKAGTVVNVIVAPSKPQAPPVMMPPPGAGPAVPPPAMAPHPPMPPAPQGGPPMVPPGMPMRKDGGRVGKEHKYPKIKAGSGSGLGRLQEAKAYGMKADDGAGKK